MALFQVTLQAPWVRKLIGKPVALTIADCEFETRRIQIDYAASSKTAESRVFRIHSDFFCPEPRIAPLRCFASTGVNRAANTSPLAFCMPIFGLPTLFFIVFVYKYVDSNVISVYSNCKIKIAMANKLKIEKKVTVISMLCEGSSIRAIERITGVNQNTIMSLGRRVGDACAKIMDEKMRNLTCKQIQVDEIWGFIGAKRKNAARAGVYGDVWTFIALDADTKLIPAFTVGKRDAYHARAFMEDLAGRLSRRVQLSSDALSAYPEAVERGFGAEVDYAQLVKTYAVTNLNKDAASRYSPAEVVKTERTVIAGMPDINRVTTSHVEKQNHTLRMHCRRLTRLTNAFSKKFENFEAAVALNFVYYNFCKSHLAIRCTPAMEAGIEKSQWTVADLLKNCGE
jgi:IS1 family transposase